MVAETRVHHSIPTAAKELAACGEWSALSERPFVVVCIGTDRSTGDAFGPLVGSRLRELLGDQVTVYGTLDDPVHAANLPQTLVQIGEEHPGAALLAVDACLGRSENVGSLAMKLGPLSPGTGVNKKLPAVGNAHIMGVVNVGGFMEYLVLQNTRLSLVMGMAWVAAEAIVMAVQVRTPAAWQAAGVR